MLRLLLGLALSAGIGCATAGLPDPPPATSPASIDAQEAPITPVRLPEAELPAATPAAHHHHHEAKEAPDAP